MTKAKITKGTTLKITLEGRDYNFQYKTGYDDSYDNALTISSRGRHINTITIHPTEENGAEHWIDAFVEELMELREAIVESHRA